MTASGTSPRVARNLESLGEDWTVRPSVFQGREQVESVPFNGFGPEDVLTLHKEGVSGTEIARRLGIGRASVYRILKYPEAS